MLIATTLVAALCLIGFRSQKPGLLRAVFAGVFLELAAIGAILAAIGGRS